ncbi:MAG TPA: DUF4350 domain-containing protein [Gemmataceae bacterium]|nr:DUF4350 domain-containing protein [Gemmataceae bacterium]
MTFPRHSIAVLILLALVAPCAAQGPKGDRANPHNARFNAQAYGRGTDAFRRLLFELHFEAVPSFADLLELPPEQSLFIMLGNPICLRPRNFPDGLRKFVEQGGAVLIATDQKPDAEAEALLSELAGVTVTGQTLVFRQPSGAGGPMPCYNGSDCCPILEPIEGLTTASGSMSVLGTLSSLLGAGGRPDLFRRDPQPGSSRLQVATNAPSRLIATEKDVTWWVKSGIHCLARLPSRCENESGEEVDPSTPQIRGSFTRLTQGLAFNDRMLFAVGGTVGKGRVLVLADHSIFINRMMLPREIHNMEFAANCLHWLRGGVSTPMEAAKAALKKDPDALQQLIGQRKYVLFWDDGKVHRDFNVPLKKVSLPPKLPPEPAIVAAIDKTIAKLEDENYFNEELLAGLDDLAGGRQRLLVSVVYLLTLAAFLFLVYRFLWRARHRLETAAPLLADAVGQHEPRATLLDQRRRALLRLGNVWEMGHCLARECFESAGVALTGASPPRVTMTQGSWRQRWRIRRRVARLWRLARGTTPVPLSPAALHHQVRELEELKTALANGTIRLT